MKILIKHYYLAGTILVGLVFFGALLGILFLYFDSKKEDLPVLIARPEKIDFGETEPKILFGSFILTNTSQYPIEILRIVRSCACTEVVYQSGELPSKASTELLCNFDTGATEGTKTGEIGVIYISHNDSCNQAQIFPLSIRATVRLPMEATIKNIK
jgi:hypothetical protein